jgi:hypothetical protein
MRQYIEDADNTLNYVWHQHPPIGMAIGRASGQSHVPERHFCRQHLGDKVIGNVGHFTMT